ncbi:hypothetical protein KP509_22G010200 [Ceratopteris richardii]|uniref:Uncharacterized protein n=1 Tax=Ceratopteris richardii TaxID=49495 RepID=A0A8T2S5W9_CERRI|nr:hypothetical protein KP509_22G010200 [Ceratopteris richardii]
MQDEWTQCPLFYRHSSLHHDFVLSPYLDATVFLPVGSACGRRHLTSTRGSARCAEKQTKTLHTQNAELQRGNLLDMETDPFQQTTHRIDNFEPPLITLRGADWLAGRTFAMLLLSSPTFSKVGLCLHRISLLNRRKIPSFTSYVFFRVQEINNLSIHL